MYRRSYWAFSEPPPAVPETAPPRRDKYGRQNGRLLWITTLLKRKLCSRASSPPVTCTLGNYLGAVKNWAELADEFNCYYFMADLHSHYRASERPQSCAAAPVTRSWRSTSPAALTRRRTPCSSRAMCLRTRSSAGSLNCYTMFGELSRMTQFKDKCAKQRRAISTAACSPIPSLMAADILLYQAGSMSLSARIRSSTCELTRDVAIRFNGIYGETCSRFPSPIYPRSARGL